MWLLKYLVSARSLDHVYNLEQILPSDFKYGHCPPPPPTLLQLWKSNPCLSWPLGFYIYPLDTTDPYDYLEGIVRVVDVTPLSTAAVYSKGRKKRHPGSLSRDVKTWRWVVFLPFVARFEAL